VLGKNRPALGVLFRRAALPLLLIVAAGAWMGYYDSRAFGKATTLPYTINRATYAMAPYYLWQKQRPEPHYRHSGMRRFYYDSEMKAYSKVHPWRYFVPGTLVKAVTAVLFFAGIALLPPLIMLRRVFHDRRIRFLVLSVLFLGAGMLIEIFMLPHYMAPFTAAFYVIGLQCMRHLRVWSPGGNPVGATLVRFTVTLCVILASVRVFAAPLGFKVAEWPPSDWGDMWYGPDHFGTERAGIEAKLEALPGKQLVIVHDSGTRDPLDQWVYNAADIDASKVVWAREMDATNNRDLMHYYADRHVWWINMDTEPATVSPYEGSEQQIAQKH
jgi:hypothetical protein